MKNSHYIDQFPFLTNENIKHDTQKNAGDFLISQNGNVGSPEGITISTDQRALIESSTSQIPVDFFKDFGFHAERTVNFLRKASKFLRDIPVEEKVTFLFAMHLTKDPLNEAGHKESQGPKSSPETSDSSPDQDRSKSGWSFFPDTVSYKGLLFEIQGVPQEILKALSESPRGISKNNLKDKVWPLKDVNDETLRSHIFSIRKCIRETLQISDNPIPNIGNGKNSGWKINFEILKMNAEDNKG